MTLTQLAQGISSTFLPTEYYSVLDCDSALDLRDGGGSFESDWVTCHEEISERWNPSLDPEAELSNESIRFHSFNIVSEATQHHEIASYISDDFDLIHRSIVLGIKHPILEFLIYSYQNGTFPSPAPDGTYKLPL